MQLKGTTDDFGTTDIIISSVSCLQISCHQSKGGFCFWGVFLYFVHAANSFWYKLAIVRKQTKSMLRKGTMKLERLSEGAPTTFHNIQPTTFPRFVFNMQVSLLPSFLL